jgi:apolipoprotein N-acyltransferase
MGFAAVVLSGLLYFASTGVNHIWPLAWIAPAPLLAVLPELRAGRAALASFLAATLGALNMVLAYRGLPPLLLGGVVLLMAVPFTAVAIAWRYVARRAGPAIAIVAFPALIVSMEYLSSVLSPHGTFGSLAYSQTDVLPVAQLASVTGLWGISFVVSLVAAVLAVAWRNRTDLRRVYPGIGFTGLLLAATLGFGAARLALPLPGSTIRVGLAASDVDVARHFAAADSGEALPVVRAYAARIGTLAAQGAQLVVLPEKFVGLAPAYAAAARALLEAAAREHQVTVVAGFNADEGSERRNLAEVFAADGHLLLSYDKAHLVPGLEQGYRRGTAVGIFADNTAAPIGVAICKDLDFVPLGRAYAHAGAGLLLVPAWDFVRDGWIHSRMAIMRGIEGGFAIARTASNGRLTVSDARGRIVAERRSDESAEVLLTAVIPVGPGGTFFSHTGDWFAWLCLAGALGCLAGSWKAR